MADTYLTIEKNTNTKREKIEIIQDYDEETERRRE